MERSVLPFLAVPTAGRCLPAVESFGLGADPHSPTRTAQPPEGPTKAALCDEAVASIGSLADPEPLSGAARDLLLTSAGRAVPTDQKHIVGPYGPPPVKVGIPAALPCGHDLPGRLARSPGNFA